MKTDATIQPLDPSFRELALAIGDGRLHQASLDGREVAYVKLATAALLTDAAPNVRIGICRLVRQNAELLAQFVPAGLLQRLQRRLRAAAETDSAANDYFYESQADELDIVFVANEARQALAALDAVSGSCAVRSEQ
jgi:hypothetical protein